MEFLKILVEEQKKRDNGLIICGFPGVGKSSVIKTKINDNLLDSDSSTFDKSKFPDNYIEHIKENISDGKTILASSHDVVRDALIENKLPFFLVYPDKSLKKEYLKRYTDRGSPVKFNTLMEENFEKWAKQCDDIDNKLVTKIKLKSGQYLSDVMDEICSIYIKDKLNSHKEINQKTMIKYFKNIIPLLRKYDKIGTVKARLANEGEKIVTEINGEKETENVAGENDVLIIGAEGEQYLVSVDTFKRRYVTLSGKEIKNVSEKLTEYKSTGKCYAFKWVNGSFSFIAAWGEKMICNDGDWLATTDTDDIEVYRIEKNVFSKTYK